ncbi:MAG: CotH kinase family protein [Pseudomonadota bacterium]
MRSLLLLLCACSHPSLPLGDTAPSDDTAPLTPPPNGERILDPAVLHEVLIELDPADWDELCAQHRNVLDMFTGDCLEAPFASPYTYFHADVTVDGEPHADVGLRKKGFIGSDSSVRPSLKLRFDEYVDGQTHEGLDRLTLNNGQQDPAVISQCLGYEIFRAAGIPASRCSFAHVTVNGEDLGVYSNVESVEPPMLARWFDDPQGDLWEGQGSDFREGWLGTFDVQEGDGDPAWLQRVVDALAEPDAGVTSALNAVIDLDAWYRYWAMEVLLGHWDGYASNTNNFFLYRDPADDRLRFLPWGIDALFDSDHPFGASMPTSVVAATALPRRLYLLAASRVAYYHHLFALLDEVWEEPALLARIDAMEALVAPAVGPDLAPGLPAAVDDIRTFVSGRRSAIQAEVVGGTPAWPYELRAWPCMVDRGEVPVTFATTWGSYATQDPFDYGEGSMSLTLDGATYATTFLGAIAGEVHGQAQIITIGRLDWGALLAVVIDLPTDRVAPGTLTMDWSVGDAYLYYDEGGTGEAWGVAAYLGDGPLILEEAGTEAGAAIRGSADLRVYGGE